MKISASIYSEKNKSLREVISDLADHHIDLLHVDCNDDLSVFDDIKEIRQWTDIPVDLHIITDKPSKYYPYLLETPVEYVTFQYEDLTEKIVFPEGISGKKGLAITTPTDISAFDEYPDFDFILIMATVPGQSGGVFDKVNFSKIRSFKKQYPTKSIHVDGGVNGEVSFILRNMGVSSSVSGSYLFNAASIGHALMNLTKREVESHFHIRDFMIPLQECPVVSHENMDFRSVLQAIEDGQLGFTLVLDKNQVFSGIISNADVRKGLLRQIDQLNAIDVESMLNSKALTLNENQTVDEMLQLIKKSSFPVMYLPVIDNTAKAVGIVTFVNLIKGEL
ncbi:MAG: domain containing protein [Crocinitomicaceae bacterium]|jgi:pentose-5-phosphate-3-epimerase|nr:domain containing protein [Crocinitomicaceae bacterium]